MTEQPAVPHWPRPYWQASDEQVLLQFYVFGKFPMDLAIPAARYGSPGLPPGVTLQRFQNAVLRRWEGYPLAGALGALLKEDTPVIHEQARLAPEVLVVRGQRPDEDSLDYLRDTLGVLAGLLDVGGSVVLDPQILTLFGAGGWRGQYLVEGGAPPRHHVLVLCHAEEGGPATGGRSRVRTRGMRKFGRPDIDLRQVPEAAVARAGALAERLVELQALGAHFVAGQPLDIEGLPGVLIAEPGGSLADPQFNNTHVAFRWPA